MELIAIMDAGMLLVRLLDSKELDIICVKDLTLDHPLVTDADSFRLGIAFALTE